MSLITEGEGGGDHPSATGPATSASPSDRGHAVRDHLGILLVSLAALSLLVWLLTQISVHVFAGNSDAATVVLEGQSMQAGHPLLEGWNLSRDSFWSVDALWYAIVIVFTGLKSSLIHLVPALIAASCVGVGWWMVRIEARGRASVVGLATLLLLIGVPSPVLGFFLLQGPWHIGTVLWSLLAFVALSTGRFKWGFAIGVLLLVAGLLGDLETIPFGVLPIFGAGLVEMLRTRNPHRGAALAVAAPLAGGIAWGLRALFRVLHGFSISTGITHAKSSQYLPNLGHAFLWLTSLFGVRGLALGTNAILGSGAPRNGPRWSRLAHVPLLVLVGVGVLYLLTRLVTALVTAKSWGGDLTAPVSKADQHEHEVEDHSRRERLDTLLLLGVVGSIADFVYLCPNTNGSYGRYLSAAVIFASILVARVVTRLVSRRPQRLLHIGLVVVFAIAGSGIGLSAADEIGRATPPPAATQLVTFLKAHQLTVGVGDYWSASEVTVLSDGAVTVRPLITNPAHRIKRYERQSSADWYRGVAFEFLVYNVRHPWRGIDASTAIWTFGRPKQGYVVGPYRVIIWPQPIRVSPIGYSAG